MRAGRRGAGRTPLSRRGTIAGATRGKAWQTAHQGANSADRCGPKDVSPEGEVESPWLWTGRRPFNGSSTKKTAVGTAKSWQRVDIDVRGGAVDLTTTWCKCEQGEPIRHAGRRVAASRTSRPASCINRSVGRGLNRPRGSTATLRGRAGRGGRPGAAAACATSCGCRRRAGRAARPRVARSSPAAGRARGDPRW